MSARSRIDGPGRAPSSVENTTDAAWDEMLDINLRAPFLLTQTVARQLPSEASGCVINLLDQRVWNLTPHFTSYTVSKAALWTLASGDLLLRGLGWNGP